MARMKKKVSMLLKKARESSILAVNVYNNPGTVFRSNGYIVLMTIAWTSLFHAIFERDNVKYFYKDKEDKRKYAYLDGEKKAWELKSCLKQYFRDINNATRKNIEFMIGIRNKIEHRFAPEVDGLIYGECQANLIDFEEVMVNEFGNKYSLADTLYFALQHSKIKTDEQLKAVRSIQSNYFKDIKDYIDNYRRNLSDDIFSDPKFSFRVFLIQKPANREKSADATLEYINFDSTDPGEMDKYENVIMLIKEKKVEVPLIPNQKEGANKFILAKDTGNQTGLPLVGITKDLSKASGVLVTEEISQEIFDDPVKIGEVALILSQKINEFPLSERAIYSVYSERERITNQSTTIKVFLNGSFSLRTGTATAPCHYWLNCLDNDDFLVFIKDCFSNCITAKIVFLNKLFISTGNSKWISFIEEIGLSYQKRFTQTHQWVWTLDEMIRNNKSSKRESIYSIRGFTPSTKIAGFTIKHLIDDTEKAKSLLSSSCYNYSIGNGAALERTEIKTLDLISYFKEINKRLPDPPPVTDYLAHNIFGRK